jgi:hypothetical protein
MTDKNHEQEHVQDSQHDELDRVLDAALTKYASVEPRPGLEDRILANLRAERTNIVEHAWWRWGLAGALLAIVIVATTLAVRPGRSAHPPVANHPTTTEQIRQPANPPTTASSVPPVENASTRATHRGSVSATRKPATRAQAVAQADPKLDVFPSPQPLSKQELALARYVRNFPTDAKRVAQAQEESEKEVLAKMQALANESTESN